ncbi:aldo/keto reductase [Vagococcus vulneris]|uniref:Aldo/keto reductase n=1 Tax=Vagococcus vulneris TaxID=1977869 RepID=A0A429ZXY5_9ENTE|nr:aldo/keto reductase [Vagococcus vulneris]RST98763.1 aldo/keto reductase [Vagococcus vulneris]
MNQIELGNSQLNVSQIGLGCMRMNQLSVSQATKIVSLCLDQGINFFDHADIYGDGASEEIFGRALQENSISRNDVIIQTKCGIRKGFYDFSKKHIISSVEGSLQRLGVDYLDCLGLHRPDALVIPEEVAEAFSELNKSGKVKHFGVSNHNPYQIDLLKKYCDQPIEFNQLQYGLMHADIVKSGLNVNNHIDSAIDRDGFVLDYSRIHNMTIQAWSPMQYGFFAGVFVNNEKFPELNQVLNELAEKYQSTASGIAVAWINKHPSDIQTLIGTMNEERIKEFSASTTVSLTKQEWYQLYQAAGNQLL